MQPAAKAFGLQVQNTDWMSRAEGAKFFKNDKLMNLVFTDEVLKERRNTEAIEVTANTSAFCTCSGLQAGSTTHFW